jgi:hypothetical protein
VLGKLLLFFIILPSLLIAIYDFKGNCKRVIADFVDLMIALIFFKVKGNGENSLATDFSDYSDYLEE